MEIIQDRTDKKVNAYTCGDCGKNTVVKHRDQGVTPFFIDCVHCEGKAISHMYKVPQDLKHDLTVFKPSTAKEWEMYRQYIKRYYKKHKAYKKQLLKDALAATKNHIDAGGVVMMPADVIKI